MVISVVSSGAKVVVCSSVLSVMLVVGVGFSVVEVGVGWNMGFKGFSGFFVVSGRKVDGAFTTLLPRSVKISSYDLFDWFTKKREIDTSIFV